MTTISAPIRLLERFLARQGTCAIAGLVAGALIGGVLSLVGLHEGSDLSLSAAELLTSWAILTAFAWVSLLFLFVALIRMLASSVLLPTLVNAGLVALFTLAIAQVLGAYQLAWLIGQLVGLLVGALLCRLSRVFARSAR